MNWQTDLTGRISELMLVSERIKEKEELWVTTLNQTDNKILPNQILSRIKTSIDDLHKLEGRLFEVVGGLSVLESKIVDQVLFLEQQISVLDDLHKNYRNNLFKATQPIIWKKV